MKNDVKKQIGESNFSLPRNDQAKPCLAPLRASDFNVAVGFEPTKEMDHQKAMAEFDLALRYLQQDPHGAALLRQAQQSVGKNGERLRVVLTNDPDSDSYDRANHTVRWCPRSGLTLDRNRIESPALGLMHEMVHAGDPNRYDEDHVKKFDGNDDPTSKDYNPDYKYHSEMERYAVAQTNLVAKGLGESDRRGYRPNKDKYGENLNAKSINPNVLYFFRRTEETKDGKTTRETTSQTADSNNRVTRTTTTENIGKDGKTSTATTTTTTVTDFNQGTRTTTDIWKDSEGRTHKREHPPEPIPGYTCAPLSENPDTIEQEHASANASPIVLDLNGDGIRTLPESETQRVYFDLNNNGFAERTGWVSPEDGFLALDLNQNGTIDNGAELFGNHTLLTNGTSAANGFEALKQYDADGNGIIDANDPVYSSLRIWQDKNSNGSTDEGELRTLDQAGIASIALDYTEHTGNDSAGNAHRQQGRYTKADGSTAAAADVWFAANPAHSRYLSATEYSKAA